MAKAPLAVCPGESESSSLRSTASQRHPGFDDARLSTNRHSLTSGGSFHRHDIVSQPRHTACFINCQSGKT